MIHINDVTLSFTVAGTTYHVLSGRRERPAGRPGATLNLTLADMIDPETIMNQQCELRVTVSNIVGTKGGVIFKGRVAGWQKRVAASGSEGGAQIQDQVEIQCVSKMADRWSLAPARITSMYDRDRLGTSDLKVDNDSLPKDANGNPVQPQQDGSRGLTAHAAIRRAATSMGYSDVIITADDYPLMRIDFTPKSGWYEPIANLLAPNEPLWADDDVNNILYILDTYKPLPADYPIRDKYLSQTNLNLSRPVREIVNQVDVLYRNDGDYESSQGRQVRVQETVQKFDFEDGEETVVVNVKYLDAADTSRVISTIKLEETVRRREGGFGLVIHQSRLVNRYKGNVKTGHTKRIENSVPTLGLVFTMQEEMRINFARQANGEYIQTSTTTTESGLCLVVDQDGQELLMPVLEAIQNKLIYEGGEFEFVTQSISKTTESLDKTGEGQFDVTTKRRDYLTNTTDLHTASRTGKPSTYDASQRLGKQERVTIENADSIALYGRRKAADFDARDLPYEPAVAAGHKWLARQFTAPREANIDLPDPDLILRRGTAIRLHDRSGEVGIFIVVGDTLTWGENQPLSQTVTLSEVLLDAGS